MKCIPVTSYHREVLLPHARRARPHGVNHRGFKVGAVGTSFRVDSRTGTPEHVKLAAANHKPQRHGGPRLCAEEKIILAKIALGYPSLDVLAVAAMTQPDDHTGHHGPVLLPCIYCRYMFSELIRVGRFKPDMPFVSENLQTGIVRAYRIGDVLDTLGADQVVWPTSTWPRLIAA